MPEWSFDGMLQHFDDAAVHAPRRPGAGRRAGSGRVSRYSQFIVPLIPASDPIPLPSGVSWGDEQDSMPLSGRARGLGSPYEPLLAPRNCRALFVRFAGCWDACQCNNWRIVSLWNRSACQSKAEVKSSSRQSLNSLTYVNSAPHPESAV